MLDGHRLRDAKGKKMKKIYMYILSILAVSCLSFDNSTQKDQAEIESNKTQMNKTENRIKESPYYVQIQEDFIGVYLPIKYIEDLTSTKNHSTVIFSKGSTYHNYLSVQKNIIYSNIKWHDGYAIENTEIEEYQFISEGNEKTIIDNRGFTYIKISPDTDNTHLVLREFISNIILEQLVVQKKITINQGSINMFNKTFQINLDYFNFPRECNLILYNKEESLFLGLIIEDKDYFFYKIDTSNQELVLVLTDEIVYRLTVD